MLTAVRPVTTDELAERISAALRRAVPQRHASKHVSRAVDADPRAVENWFSAHCPPRSADLITLMAACEDVRAEVDRLVQEARAARVHRDV